MLEGGCACGEVRYRLTSDPLHALLSLPQLSAADRQCVRHQRADRSRPRRAAGGRAEAGRRTRSGGKKQRIFRCPTCEIAVYSRYTRASILFVRAGTLDDPSRVAPDVHIYTRSKLSWVTLPDSVPAFTTYYDTQKLWPAASLDRLGAITASKRSAG